MTFAHGNLANPVVRIYKPAATFHLVFFPNMRFFRLWDSFRLLICQTGINVTHAGCYPKYPCDTVEIFSAHKKHPRMVWALPLLVWRTFGEVKKSNVSFAVMRLRIFSGALIGLFSVFFEYKESEARYPVKQAMESSCRVLCTEMLHWRGS